MDVIASYEKNYSMSLMVDINRRYSAYMFLCDHNKENHGIPFSPLAKHEDEENRPSSFSHEPHVKEISDI